ncbi:hypothetical protein BV378_06250 [Nostoc sp. RF31YmG]|nr:hypothetical protein BV378_06250 [Nostoc sp. RF31YmG]
MVHKELSYAEANAPYSRGIMTAVSPVVKPISLMRLAPGSVVTIQDVSWEEFESQMIPVTIEQAWQVGSVQALEEFENEINSTYF